MIEVQVAKIQLRVARVQLRWTQKDLAERAELSVSTVIVAERGESIRLLSAQALLDALNAGRIDRGMSPLGLYDVSWTLQGE